MNQQMTREERAERLAAIREERRMILERARRRSFELAVRLSELHVEQAVRRLRGVR
jgi:hypothetical protein